MKKIAVLGTGNIAQTVAVDLKSNGHEVRLFAPDYLISRIQKIVDTHEIECVGVFEAKEKIESLGGKVVGTVSKKTFALVNNDVESNSSKNKKAKELGVRIISEDELLKLLE